MLLRIQKKKVKTECMISSIMRLGEQEIRGLLRYSYLDWSTGNPAKQAMLQV